MSGTRSLGGLSRTQARVLPFAEWWRLGGTELDHLSGLDQEPEGVRVVVVEQEGELVACWASVTAMHVEGLWYRPDKHHSSAVGRALLEEMTRLLQSAGATEVLTLAVSEEIEAMIARVGGRLVPGRLWVFPVPPDRRNN